MLIEIAAEDRMDPSQFGDRVVMLVDAAHAEQRPQNVTSALAIANPAVFDGVRQGAWPTAQSTSAIAPQLVHTT